METQVQFYPVVLLISACTFCGIAISHTSLYKFVKGFFLVSILLSVAMKTVDEYVSIQAEYKLTIANAPQECFMDLGQHECFLYIWLHIKLFFKSLTGDYCSKYRMAILMEPFAFFKVSLLKVISITLTEFCYVPLEHLGTAFSKFFNNAFSDTPLLLLIPKFLLLVIVIIAVALAVSPITFTIIKGLLQRFMFLTWNDRVAELQGNNWHQHAPAVGPHCYAPRRCCYHPQRYNAVEDLQMAGCQPPLTSLYPKNGNSDDWRRLLMDERFFSRDRDPILSDSVGPEIEDLYHNLLFIEEKLATLVKFASNDGSEEQISSIASLMKGALKDLKSLGVENFWIAYKDVSTQLDLIADCSASLGSYFACHVTRMLPVIVLTEMKDSIQKLRTLMQDQERKKIIEVGSLDTPPSQKQLQVKSLLEETTEGRSYIVYNPVNSC